ncbi:ABC transporter substrate-binding protein [Chelativorans alearense]|uniref:ABC transporter substrate-binding protein n=1 Tax=Chelativorans alearense TaxID=2681495 RepID=UPI0013D6B5D4|nr:ABC transporter substrate-binding protein [Chelativorans alearense]
MRFFATIAFIAAGLTASAAPAWAAMKMKVAYTPNGVTAPLYVAKDKGIFEAHGLDVELVPVPVNSTLPAAIMSGSVQSGTFTPTVFIQAVQAGLDLQAIAGMTVTSREAMQVGIVARTGSGVESVEDLAGKRVGVPGISAVLDIMARRIMLMHGVDINSLSYTETPFPVQMDILNAGTIDAVVTVDPFYSRIQDAGVGTPIGDLLEGIPDGQTAQFFGVSTTWADENPEAVEAFRAAIRDGAQFVRDNPDETRAVIGAYLKLPPAILSDIVLPVVDAEITPEQIAWWIDVMDEQGLIEGKLDVDAMVRD